MKKVRDMGFNTFKPILKYDLIDGALLISVSFSSFFFLKTPRNWDIGKFSEKIHLDIDFSFYVQGGGISTRPRF